MFDLMGKKVYKCKDCLVVILYEYEHKEHISRTGHTKFDEVWI